MIIILDILVWCCANYWLLQVYNAELYYNNLQGNAVNCDFCKVCNERLSALSVEMDELNIRQEETSKLELTKLEQKWQEQIRILKKSTEIELDMKTNLIEEQQRYEIIVIHRILFVI